MTIAGRFPWEVFKDAPAEDACLTLIKSKEKDIEDKLFQRWIVGYQFEMPFDEFKKKLTPIKVRPDKEILDEVNGYLEMFQGGFRQMEI